MRVFDSSKGWQEKVNFVDSNNVFIGYDTHQECCATAGWFLSYKESEIYYDDIVKLTNAELEPYVFDKDYLENMRGDFDEVRGIRCRLTAPDKPDLYLHIYSTQMGVIDTGYQSKI